jgi:ankyrin repeat protein
MRRRSDGWLNATQILKVAGVDKGKRTKVLEKEILTGEHEKVQGGYGKYQGTWISYRRGREFCRQYGVEDILRPLLDYDVSADGSSGPGTQETPTKEQAMAAQRKKFYNNGNTSNSSMDPRSNGPNGTFFSNISPTTSVALAAMNKAARLNSPRPRPSNMRRESQQDLTGSQQSEDNNQHNGEPPRKRMRPDSQDMGPPDLPYDASMRSMTPTEPNESFLYEHALMQDSVNNSGEPIALPPLPSPTTDEQQEKMNLILDLFAEQGNRTDYAAHPAMQQLQNEDFNMPLDASANNALHWAATLAKIPLLKLLIQKGASIWRGNAAGQSPLISAVLVNNCWEHASFPDVLELLGPLIEVRDVQGRTILHHIAVSSGIKGRAGSSKYYLEALLEFLVRIGTGHSSESVNGERDEVVGRGPVSLVRFLSHIVNARDKAGNTALNLVARIGNRSIIQQLVEIHADPGLANNKGVCARDFHPDIGGINSQQTSSGAVASQQSAHTPAAPRMTLDSDDEQKTPKASLSASQSEDLNTELQTMLASLFGENLALQKDLLARRTARIDELNSEIRTLSAQQREEREAYELAREKEKLRTEARAKVRNLRREIEMIKRKKQTSSRSATVALEPESLEKGSTNLLAARVRAFSKQNAALNQHAAELRSRSTDLENMYRKVVARCTGVREGDVERNLEGLVAAVESENWSGGGGQGGEGENVGRVREFLSRLGMRLRELVERVLRSIIWMP